MTRTVSQLIRYPIKGCRGEWLSSAKLGLSGLQHDRQFVICWKEPADSAKLRYPTMALSQNGGNNKILPLICPRVGEGSLYLEAPALGMPELEIPIAAPSSDVEEIWYGYHKRKALAHPLVGCEEWLTKIMRDTVKGKEDKQFCLYQLCDDDTTGVERVMHIWEENGERIKNYLPEVSLEDVISGHANAPLHLVTEYSHEYLNKQLVDEFLNIDRWRANIVIKGQEAPFEENDWESCTVGEMPAQSVPTWRCSMPYTDQENGEWRRGEVRELRRVFDRELNPYNGQDADFQPPFYGDRSEGGNAVFGTWLMHGPYRGELCVGDEVVPVFRKDFQ